MHMDAHKHPEIRHICWHQRTFLLQHQDQRHLPSRDWQAHSTKNASWSVPWLQVFPYRHILLPQAGRYPRPSWETASLPSWGPTKCPTSYRMKSILLSLISMLPWSPQHGDTCFSFHLCAHHSCLVCNCAQNEALPSLNTPHWFSQPCSHPCDCPCLSLWFLLLSTTYLLRASSHITSSLNLSCFSQEDYFFLNLLQQQVLRVSVKALICTELVFLCTSTYPRWELTEGRGWVLFPVASLSLILGPGAEETLRVLA